MARLDIIIETQENLQIPAIYTDCVPKIGETLELTVIQNSRTQNWTKTYNLIIKAINHKISKSLASTQQTHIVQLTCQQCETKL